MKKILILLIAVFSGVGIVSAQTANHVVTNLSADRFKVMIAADKTAEIIDLRTSDEINREGYIKGAVQLDFLAKDAEKKIDALDKTKTYYIYCESGGRSADAAEYMEKQKFIRVYNLEKGFSDWKSHGLPVEKK